MWALLVIIMSGKSDSFGWCQIAVMRKYWGNVWVHLVVFVSAYSKLIGWVIEGREYAAAGGDQSFLVVVLCYMFMNY